MKQLGGAELRRRGRRRRPIGRVATAVGPEQCDELVLSSIERGTGGTVLLQRLLVSRLDEARRERVPASDQRSVDCGRCVLRRKQRVMNPLRSERVERERRVADAREPIAKNRRPLRDRGIGGANAGSEKKRRTRGEGALVQAIEQSSGAVAAGPAARRFQIDEERDAGARLGAARGPEPSVPQGFDSRLHFAER